MNQEPSAQAIPAANYRKKADRCYWLASSSSDARVAATLRALGDDYEALASRSD